MATIAATDTAAAADAEIQAVVLGVLWECTEEHLTTLDRFEGVAEGRYYRARVSVSPLDSEGGVDSALVDSALAESALVYIDPVTEAGPPRPGYLERVIHGAREHHLPGAYVSGTLEPWLTN